MKDFGMRSPALTPRLARVLVSVVALFVSMGCSSTLPDYAAPRGQIVDGAELDQSDLITYRKLSRDDFKGTEPPAEFRQVAEQVGAASCVRTVTSPDTRLSATETRSSSGRSSFEGRIEKLRFVAFLDRTCSWWNPNFSAASESYILEHEQIHFALHEIETRRLNASAQALARERFTGSNSDEVQRQANQKIEAVLRQTLDATISRNRSFDEDTSLGYKPAKQKEWLAVVTSELAKTKP